MNPQDRDYFGFEFTGGPAFTTENAPAGQTQQAEQSEEDIKTGQTNGTP